MKIFLTSDTHYSHMNIIRYCNRPFEGVRAMNKVLLQRWNDVVSEDDIVIHLGDVTLLKPVKHIVDLLERLKGRKILIRGNHDHKKLVEHCRSIQWLIFNNIETENTIFIHKPPQHSQKTFVFHGHTHGEYRGQMNYFDAGVDSVADYSPILFRDVIKLMQNNDSLAESIEKEVIKHIEALSLGVEESDG